MSDDRLDPLLHALRSPARAGELRGEPEAVESMMSALTVTTVQEAPTMFRRSPHRFRVAAVVAAGVFGFAGVAAAGPGGFARSSLDATVAQFDEDLDDENENEDETEIAESAEDETDGDGDGASAEDGDDDTTDGEGDDSTDGDADADDAGDGTVDGDDAEPEIAATEDDGSDTENDEEVAEEGDPKVCDGYANHGERVSEAAQTVPGGPHKGEIISAIASDQNCDVLLEDLWPLDETEGDDTESEDETPEEGTDEATEAVETERGNRPDHAGPPADRTTPEDDTPGNGNGNGNGGGNGNANGRPGNPGRPENPGRPDRD